MGASCDSLTCIGWDQIKATARYAGASSDDELLRRSDSCRHQPSPKPVPKRVEVPDTPSRFQTIALRARQLTKRTADAYSLLGADPGPDRLAASIPRPRARRFLLNPSPCSAISSPPSSPCLRVG